jgi:tetratricopeptide (TPR) repeat protein
MEAGNFDDAIAIAQEDVDSFNRLWSLLEIAKSLAQSGQEARARAVLQSAEAEINSEPIASYEEYDLKWLDMNLALAELALGASDKTLSRVDQDFVASNNPNFFHEAALLFAQRGDTETATQVFAQHTAVVQEREYLTVRAAEVARMITSISGAEPARAFMASVDYSGQRPLIVEADRAQVQFLLAGYAARDGDEAEAFSELQMSLARQPHWFPNYSLMVDFCDVSPPSFVARALSTLASRADVSQSKWNHHARYADALIACGRRDDARNLIGLIEDAEHRARLLGRFSVTQ